MNTFTLDKLGGRKFLLCLITQLLTALLVWFTKIEQGAYTTITLAIVGAYITGNVLQKKQITDATLTQR